jgi:hypothetical protein
MQPSSDRRGSRGLTSRTDGIFAGRGESTCAESCSSFAALLAMRAPAAPRAASKSWISVFPDGFESVLATPAWRSGRASRASWSPGPPTTRSFSSAEKGIEPIAAVEDDGIVDVSCSTTILDSRRLRSRCSGPVAVARGGSLLDRQGLMR